MYHQTSKNAAPPAQAKSQKYNTIDAQNAQHGGGGVSPSPAHINTSGISPAPQGHHGETAATGASTNPSNDVNANSEFIDVMRKVPRVLCERFGCAARRESFARSDRESRKFEFASADNYIPDGGAE